MIFVTNMYTNQYNINEQPVEQAWLLSKDSKEEDKTSCEIKYSVQTQASNPTRDNTYIV